MVNVASPDTSSSTAPRTPEATNVGAVRSTGQHVGGGRYGSDGEAGGEQRPVQGDGEGEGNQTAPASSVWATPVRAPKTSALALPSSFSV